MTDRRDNAPPPDGWQTAPRCCPFENCWACEQEPTGFGTYPIPPNIVLGDE